MKLRFLKAFWRAAITMASLSLLPGSAVAVVGFFNARFQVGENFIGNPLLHTSTSLSFLIQSAPLGTTVSLWDSAANGYSTAATWNGISWSTDLTLAPGTGALLNTPALFTNTFTGLVLNLDGSTYETTFIEPPPFAGADGRYLFSSKSPLNLSGNVFDPSKGKFSVFEAIVGRAPHNGEQVTTLDPLTQIYTTTTFMDGVWDNGAPALAPSQAALFNIGPIPEPSAFGILALGFGALAIRKLRSSRS